MMQDQRAPTRSADALPVTILPARAYRLNRSRKHDGKSGSYNGKPIRSAQRQFGELVLARVRVA